MASYTVDIPAEFERGITAAREAYNAGQTETIPDSTHPDQQVPNPAFFTTNLDYITFVMIGAAKSYHAQYPENACPAPTPAPTQAPAPTPAPTAPPAAKGV